MIAQTKALEDENRRLKKIFVKRGVQADLLTEALLKCMVRRAIAGVLMGDAPACAKFSGF